jgi:hypothetical protein
MYEKEYSWACDAAKQLGWLPQTIFSQWVLETNWFRSNNFKINHNIAGQTWYEGCGLPQGTPRSQSEGGYYIQYSDPVRGYVDFITHNAKRYGKVKTFKTVEEQVKAIKDAGWAVDPQYVSKVMSVYRSCLVPVVKKEITSLVDYLKSKRLPSDFQSRRNLAYKYRVVSDPHHYSGTLEQNMKILAKLQS